MISINVIYGAGYVDDDDRDRAKAAALAVLEAEGFSPAEAFAAFVTEWAYLESEEAAEAGRCQDYADLRDPKAIAWADAEAAADRALTEGWARPDGAACSITA